MESLICLDCTNSACCKKYQVDISRDEFKRYRKKGYKVISYGEETVKKHPELKNKLIQIENIHKEETFGYMLKGDDGYCEMMDRKTMLCSIHDERPKVCSDYEPSRCEKIREIKQGI